MGTEGHTGQTGHLGCVCYSEHQALNCPAQARPWMQWSPLVPSWVLLTGGGRWSGETLTKQNSNCNLILITGLCVKRQDVWQCEDANPLLAGRRLSSAEAGLLRGTNTTTMFWVQDECYAWLWSCKVTQFPASVPRGKRSKSGKGKRKRPAEALLWINLFLGTENVLESTLSESACSSRGRMTSR